MFRQDNAWQLFNTNHIICEYFTGKTAIHHFKHHTQN
jgi:hypothetical protein